MSVLARCIALWLVLAGSWSPAVLAGPVVLTAEEQQWIKAHPVLRVGVVGDLIPFEYLSAGVLRGLSSHYLEVVSRATGLQFTYVPNPSMVEREAMLLHGQVDLLSTHFRYEGAPVSTDLLLFPYHSSSPIIVTRVDSPAVFDLEQLQGKTVAVPNVEHYEAMFRKKTIKARLIKSSSAPDMLTMVKDGRADAVVASETFLMPYLYRQFQGILETSGVVSGQQLDVSMAVAADQKLLYSILDKVLASITVEQRKDIYRRWYGDLDMDVPSILSITEHYFHALMLGVVMLLSLCVLVYLSHRQRRRAVRNEQEKTVFLAVMSHEIRSPMNALLAAMELLGHTRLNTQQRHFVQLTNSGANVLLRLLDDVLDVSKLEAGHLHLEVEATDVTALVQGVVGLHRLRALKKNLELNQRLQAQLPWVRLDSTRLAQILHNLLSNAIKFTEAGHVDIDVRLEAQETGGQQLLIEVCDTGIGISEGVQASLFRAYAQDSHSYKRSGGTGLGLVICQQLVSLMNGTLDLSSQWGSGTRVTIRLPVQLASAEAAALADNAQLMPQSSTAAAALRVLVVEDIQANQQVLRAQISGFGCQPVIAGDAAQARALFWGSVYDLILMDCDLPDQDGYSLVRELRAIEVQLGRSRCPIISISAMTGAQHLERCLEAGMEGSLSKPIGLGKLRQAIEQYCKVTLMAPGAGALSPALDSAALTEEMARDMGRLIKAMALANRQDALHAAHRVHGAALMLQWPALAEAGKTLDTLLRADTREDNPACVQALKALIQHWHAASGAQPVEVLPSGPSHRLAPL